jgi:hypothetical protein
MQCNDFLHRNVAKAMLMTTTEKDFIRRRHLLLSAVVSLVCGAAQDQQISKVSRNVQRDVGAILSFLKIYRHRAIFF